MQFEKINRIHEERAEEGCAHYVAYNLSTLANMARVSADKFSENATTLEKVARAGGNPFMTATAAERTAQQFREQAEEALDLYWKIQGTKRIILVNVEEEEESA